MMVALQLPLWGKALCEYPVFLVRKMGRAIHDRETFEINTRESVTIDIAVPIGFI